MKKGFTLVELLAVIVILAVILVIAIPQINNVINETRKNSLASTAKLVAAKAEEKIVENEALESNETISCASLVKLDDNYGNCTISVINGVATVTLNGAGKFAGYICTGTKASMNCVEGESTELACDSEYCYFFGSEIQISENDDIKEDWKDLKDSSDKQIPVFLKFKNDLSEMYTCTTYNIGDGEPVCISANVYTEYANATDKTQTEWNAVKTIFASNVCSETTSTIGCSKPNGFYTWDCYAHAGYATCNYDNGSVYLACHVYDNGSAQCNNP